MGWEGGDRERGWTRREWVRFGMAVGTIGTIGSLGALSGRQLIPPPIEFTGEIRETLYYTRFPTAQWWNDKAGQPMKLRDFELWRGATGVRRGPGAAGRAGGWRPPGGFGGGGPAGPGAPRTTTKGCASSSSSTGACTSA